MHTITKAKGSTAAIGLFFCALAPITAHSANSESLSEKHRAELVAFSARALGVKVSTSEVKKNTPISDVYELVATGINLNGHLCARVTGITPLKVTGGYEVICIANRGGSATKAYNVDANLGKAHPL